jgi:hypothetical protein
MQQPVLKDVLPTGRERKLFFLRLRRKQCEGGKCEKV